MAYGSFAELLGATAAHGSLGRAALAREAFDTSTSEADVLQRMDESLTVMEDAVAAGLADATRSRSGLSGGDAARMAASAPQAVDARMTNALSAALAVAEVNARMGRVVAAPTGGASGVLPAVLVTISQQQGTSREETVLATLAAAAVGGVIAARATLSGAAGGCQAEIGSAAAMAAAAAVELIGGMPTQSGHAAAFAIQGLLGLVCDPIGGLVEVPCIARNATATAVALTSAQMALAGMEFPIPLDEVIDTMGQVGRSLPPSLRETALGGLAASPTGRKLGANVCQGIGCPAR